MSNVYFHSLGCFRIYPVLLSTSSLNWESSSFFLSIIIDPLASNANEELCLLGGGTNLINTAENPY